MPAKLPAEVKPRKTRGRQKAATKTTARELERKRKKPGPKPKGRPRRELFKVPGAQERIDCDAFADLLFKHGGNASAALRELGHAGPHLAQDAYRLARRKDVQEAVAVRKAKLLAANLVTAEATVKELARIGFYDIADLYGEDGNLLHPKNMPEHMRHAIVSVEHDSIGEGIVRTRIRLADKVSALEKLSRHFGLFEKDNMQRPANQVAVILADINQGRVNLLPQQSAIEHAEGSRVLDHQAEQPGIRILDSLRQG